MYKKLITALIIFFSLGLLLCAAIRTVIYWVQNDYYTLMQIIKYSISTYGWFYFIGIVLYLLTWFSLAKHNTSHF